MCAFIARHPNRGIDLSERCRSRGKVIPVDVPRRPFGEINSSGDVALWMGTMCGGDCVCMLSYHLACRYKAICAFCKRKLKWVSQ